MTAEVPNDQLQPGVWRFALRSAEEDDFRRLEARLLIKPEQPIALLVGPRPDTAMAPPPPRGASSGPEITSGGRARRGVVHIVDSALARLPEERASRYRAALGRAARRLRR